MCWLMKTWLPTDSRNCILLMRAYRDHVGSSIFNQHRQWREAAGTTQHEFAAGHHAHHRVVHVPDDRSIVHQEEIGNARKAAAPPPARECRSVHRMTLPLVATTGIPSSCISR